MRSLTLDMSAFDEARLEWEFAKVQEEHRHCCAGAALFNGQWIAFIVPFPDSTWRDWDEE